jgi:hypothetical protein
MTAAAVSGVGAGLPKLASRGLDVVLSLLSPIEVRLGSAEP